jgi:glycosyltransferase involved in cell wall biosynthesis
VSDHTRDELVAHVPAARAKALVIPNGVDPAGFAAWHDAAEVRRGLGLSADCFVVGTVGRTHPVKGHADLVMAFAALAHGEREPPHLLIVGQPLEPWAQQLALQARALGVGNLVHLLGERSDVPALLAAMDVFVLPSHSEGMPNALLEAMAAARPVVATRVGGSAEVITDGLTGLAVPPRDPGALASAIGQLRSDPLLGKRLGAAARRQVAQRFSWSAALDSYEALLEGLLPLDHGALEGGPRRRLRGPLRAAGRY